jgi:hypothetical protein
MILYLIFFSSVCCFRFLPRDSSNHDDDVLSREEKEYLLVYLIHSRFRTKLSSTMRIKILYRIHYWHKQHNYNYNFESILASISSYRLFPITLLFLTIKQCCHTIPKRSCCAFSLLRVHLHHPFKYRRRCRRRHC